MACGAKPLRLSPGICRKSHHIIFKNVAISDVWLIENGKKTCVRDVFEYQWYLPTTKFNYFDFTLEIEIFNCSRFIFLHVPPPNDPSSRVPKLHSPDLGKNPGFFLRTRDSSEKPGFFPQITGKDEVSLQTREICRVGKLRVYIYL